MIKCNVGPMWRFLVRGFDDRIQDLDAYACATSRSVRRIVNAVVAEKQGLILFSFDASQVSTKKSKTSHEFSEFIGQGIGQVAFDVPKVDAQRPGQIPDCKDCGPNGAALIMLKQMYGLKDAPRAWRKQLHQGLIQWLVCRRLYADSELSCVRIEDEHLL